MSEEGRTRLRPAWHRGRSHYCGGEHQDGMNFFGRKHQAGSSSSSPGGTQRSAHKTHLNPEVSTDGLVTCELVTGAVSAENTDPGAPARVSNMMMAGEALVWMDQDHPRGTMVIGGMQGVKQGSIKKKKTSTSSATTKVYGGGTLPPVTAEEPAPTNACMTKMVQRASEKFCCAQGWEHLNSLRQTGTSRALGAGPDIWGYQAGGDKTGSYRSTPPPALPQHSTRLNQQPHLHKLHLMSLLRRMTRVSRRAPSASRPLSGA